jgi:two-component system OmpR family response regulator
MTVSSRRLRVLVVDDLPDATEIMCVLIEALGHDVRGAVNATEALAIADELHPQLAILDIGLPDLSGYELARELRRRASGKRLHLAALTGWGTSHDRVSALAAGFDQHFLKPADERVVRQIIESAVLTLASPPISLPEVRPS